MARIDPKPSDIKALFALSGNQCAFPGCQNLLISNKGHLVGQLAHIEAANKNGPRFNKNQSEDERRSFSNLILLCYEHHTEIDEFKDEYPVPRLKQIKKEHEDQFRQDPYEVTESALNKAIQSIHSELERITVLSQDINQVVHNTQDTVNEIYNRLLGRSSAEEDKLYFDQQLATIKEVKKQGKYKTAVELLLLYREKNWEKIDPEKKYKVLANLGITYLDLQQKGKAAEHFQAIMHTGYETADSLSFLAMGYALDDKHAEFDASFEQAVRLGSDNVNLWVAYVERHKKDKAINQIMSEVPEQIRDSVPMLFTIGTRLIEEGQKAEGISFLKKTLEKQEDDPEKISDTKAVIATYLLKDLADPFKFVHKLYSEEELNELAEAKQLFTEAWEVVGETELAKYKWYVILNRGVINKITGKLESALTDMQKAYDVSREYVAFKNLLFLNIQLNRFSTAEELLTITEFAKPLNEEERFEVQTFKARLVFLQGQTEEGIRLMSSLLDETNDPRFIEIATHIVAMSLEHRRPDLGIAICEDLMAKFPDLYSGYLFYGYIWKAKNDNQKAIEYFDRAAALLPSAASYNDINVLASGYIDLNQYEKAIPLFERVVDKNILNDFSRGLIHAYFGLGDLQAAFALADHLFKRWPDSVYLAEIISTIYEETKQYDKAIEILEKFLPSGDDKVNDVLSYRCARLYAFKRDWENTRRWASQVKHPENFYLREVFRLAWLFLESGSPDKSLEIAFDARTKFFNDGDAHYNYFSIITAVDRKSPSVSPEAVRPESAVYVRLETGEEKTFLVTEKEINGENVLPPNDPFALQLLGKKIDESISTDNGFSFTNSITVIGIKDIYTHAFHETLKLLETRFAGQHPIGIFHHANPGAPDDPMADVIKSLTLNNRASQKELFALYNQRKATIGMLAWANHRSQVMQLFALMSSPEVSILSFTRNEYPAADHALSTGAPVILDLTSLITLFFVYRKQNLLSLLDNTFIVSRSTVDELHACHEELGRSAEDGLFTMGYEDGKLVGHMTPKETIREHQALLKAIIDWCEQHAQIAVSKKQVEFKREERKKYAGKLGECYFDTLLLAEEHGAAVISDDDNFKNFLRAGKTLEPFSTYSLGHWLLGKGKLNMEAFDQLRTSLIQANYIFIPVAADILWQCFDAGAFQIRRPFTTAVKGLIIMLSLACAQQLTEFLKKLYLSNILSTTREQVLLYVFKEVSARHDFATIKKQLIDTINEEFNLLPLSGKDILELLSAY